jgi:hypothetical protein
MRLAARSFRVTAAVIALVLSGIPAAAQDSREETIVKAQQEKATSLRPYQPNKLEQVLNQLQKTLTLAPTGVYPTFGSVYSGGGFTIGAGYRRYIGDRVNWNVTGLYSAKNYKLLELTLHSPRPLTGRLDYNITTSWRDATQVAFHGLGIDSPAEETRFRLQQGYAGGRAWLRPQPWAVVHGALAYEAFTLGDGHGAAPDVDDVFTPETAPGLGQSPDYVHTTFSGAVDTRNSPEYTRRGGLVEVAFHHYRDRDDQYSFKRVDTELVGHIPLRRETWVISLRSRLQSTIGDEDVVPYFMLPALGSGSSLRGYSSWRFRDRHSLLFSAEWRWFPNRMALDAAIFADAGTVADRRDALSFGRMVGDVGIGLRFHSPVATPLRIELAGGREGMRVIFAAHAAF